MIRITPQTRIVAIDLETTGLSPTRDRIVELAAVCCQDGKETGHFQALVHPGRSIPDPAIRIHGITDEMVNEAPPVAELLPAFLDFCTAELLIAHNTPFDLRFLTVECARAGLTFSPERVADTCELAKVYLPHCPNYRLETLKTVLGIGDHQDHRALADARDCLAVFLAFMRGDVVPRCLPITARARNNNDNKDLVMVCETLERGGTLIIEYEDARGNTTCREIRPLSVDGITVEAFCLLRNDKRHFAIERIKRAWRP